MTHSTVSPDDTTARCRSCDAAVVWVAMPSGKRMPLDAEPAPDGTVALGEHGHTAKVLTGAELRGARDLGQPLYRSHFATCPQAGEHRRVR